MEFNSDFNKENLSQVYNQNRQLVVPILAIVVSVILLIFIVLPELLSFPSNKSEADEESLKLNRIQAAYDLLNNTSEHFVDEDLALAQSALPDKKDFQSVLGAISVASANSNTQIFNYAYIATTTSSTEKYPSLLFKVEIVGGIKEGVAFINELYKTYPMSNVTNLTNTNNTSTMDIIFYYRAFPPITVDDRTMVSKKNPDQEKALKTISGWNRGGLELQDSEQATSSSTPF